MTYLHEVYNLILFIAVIAVTVDVWEYNITPRLERWHHRLIEWIWEQTDKLDE